MGDHNENKSTSTVPNQPAATGFFECIAIPPPIYGTNQVTVDESDPLVDANQERTSSASLLSPPYQIAQDETSVDQGPIYIPDDHGTDEKDDKTQDDKEPDNNNQKDIGAGDEEKPDDHSDEIIINDDSNETVNDEKGTAQIFDITSDENPSSTNTDMKTSGTQASNIANSLSGAWSKATDESKTSTSHAQLYKSKNGGSCNLGGPQKTPLVSDEPGNSTQLPVWKGGVMPTAFSAFSAVTPNGNNDKKSDKLVKDPTAVKDENHETVADNFLLKMHKKYILEPGEEWKRLALKAKEKNKDFNALRIVMKLHFALIGHASFLKKTLKDQVYAALEGLNEFEISVVKKCYKHTYNIDLKIHIDLGFAGIEKNRVEALMESNSLKADAAKLFKAMLIFNKDEKAIMGTLRRKTKDEKVKLFEIFKKEYSIDFLTHLNNVLDGHDLDRANALIEGNTAKADAIAQDQAMNGGWFFGAGKDKDALNATNSDIRKDVELDFQQKRNEVIQHAKEKRWTEDQLNNELKSRGLLSADIEKSVSKKLHKTELAFNDNYASNYDLAEGESAYRAELKDEFSGAALDLYNANSDNEHRTMDSAGIKNELESLLYASDDKINAVLEKQYDRSLQQIILDKMPGVELRIEKEAVKNNWTTELLTIKKREAIAALEKKAQSKAKQSMNLLEDQYNSNYGDFSTSFKSDIRFETQGLGEEKARSLMKQGYLTPAQQAFYATEGLGTESAKLKKVVTGKTKEEIVEIDDEFKKLSRGKSLASVIGDEESGGTQFDLLMSMEGMSATQEESLDKTKRRSEREDDKIVTEQYQWAQKHYNISKDPNASKHDIAQSNKYFDQGVENVEIAVNSVRQHDQALANSIAQAAAMAASIIVAAAITYLSGGTASAAGKGLVSKLSSWFMTSGRLAVFSSGASLGVSMATKGIMLGGDYKESEIKNDLGIGAIDIFVAGYASRMRLGDKIDDFFKGTGEVSKSKAILFIQNAGAEYSENFFTGIPSSIAQEYWVGEGPFIDLLLNALENNLENAAIATGPGLIGRGVNKLAKKYSPFISKVDSTSGKSEATKPDANIPESTTLSNTKTTETKSDQLAINDSSSKVDANSIPKSSQDIVETPSNTTTTETKSDQLAINDSSSKVDANSIINSKPEVVADTSTNKAVDPLDAIEISNPGLNNSNELTPLNSEITPIKSDQATVNEPTVNVEAEAVSIPKPDVINTPTTNKAKPVKSNQATVNEPTAKVEGNAKTKSKHDLVAGNKASNKAVDPWDGIKINNPAEQMAKDRGLPPEPKGYDYKLSTKDTLSIQRTDVKNLGGEPLEKLVIVDNKLVPVPE